jgi:DNA-binding MarR family transcriptional regulator
MAMSMKAIRGAPASASTKELVEHLGLEIRRMGAQTVLRSQVIADRFGLHTTDLECLDLIYMQGKASAGELARATGLTSGATTALIDRLEKAGYVLREGDPTDRRRRFVRIRAEAIEPIKAVYEPLQKEMFKLWSSFSTRDLRLIADFVRRSTEVSIACIEKMQTEANGPLSRSSRKQPGDRRVG